MRTTWRDERRLAVAVLLVTLAAGCQGSLLVAGVSFAPWMGCALVGSLIAYVIARVLEARLFAYDPRWFVWTFLALTVLCSIALWNLVARPPPG
jgi:hypothetical protein